jgi:hypothetical protein
MYLTQDRDRLSVSKQATKEILNLGKVNDVEVKE